MTGKRPVTRDDLIEAAARVIYRIWWEDGEPDTDAEWENLAADDSDRHDAWRYARAGLDEALPLIADAIVREREAAGSWEHPADAGFMRGMTDAAALVRSLAVHPEGDR